MNLSDVIASRLNNVVTIVVLLAYGIFIVYISLELNYKVYFVIT